jgi:phospholipid transport system substrate-binding protein
MNNLGDLMIKNKFNTFTISAFLIFVSTPILALNTNDAESYVSKVSGVVETILDTKRDKEEVYKDFQQMFEKYADLPIITRFLIGPPAREMNEEQLKRAEEVISVYLSRKYGKQFENYIGTQIDILNSFQKGQNNVFVETNIGSSQYDDFMVAWRVSDKSGEMKLIDIIIEGISMLKIEKGEIGSRLEKSNYNIENFIASFQK